MYRNEIITILNKCIELIQKDGWRQSVDEDGWSVDGAIIIASYYFYEEHQARRLCRIADNMLGRHIDSNVADWNDSFVSKDGNATQEIVDIIKECIARVKDGSLSYNPE